MSKKKDIYEDIDALTEGLDKAESPRQDVTPRRRSTGPAASRFIRGQEGSASKGVSQTKQLREEIEALKENLDSYEHKMPVTGLAVRFKLQKINPDLIDVSPENERDQALLTLPAVADILPDIEKYQQQEPGFVRPKEGGRFELIAGSRRKFCAQHLNRDFLAFVGDVPDADVRVMSRTENKQSPISPWEKAHSIARDIERGLYTDWTHAAAVEGVTRQALQKYKVLLDVDRDFVSAFPSPSDINTTRGRWIVNVKNQDAKLYGKIRYLARELGKDGVERSAEDVFKLLKAKAREQNKVKQPSKKAPIEYKVGGGKLVDRLSRDGKTRKLELTGIDDELVRRVVEEVKSILGATE